MCPPGEIKVTDTAIATAMLLVLPAGIAHGSDARVAVTQGLVRLRVLQYTETTNCKVRFLIAC